MTVRKYQSRSQKTALASPLAAGASTMTVNSGALLVVSTIPSGATFTVVIDPDTSLEEIVEVVNWSSGNTLTINRGIDGSSDIGHSAGAVVRHMAIGRDHREANEHIENVTTAHGLTIADVVTKTATQVLTNKDLSSATNTLSTAVVTLTGTQTLTNKTLTSPKINENVAVTATATELNYVDGVTSAIQTQLDAKQAVVSGVSSTEIGYLDGVTSAIQTQIDGKQALVSGVSSAEIGYLDGVTSAIQTQIDTKAPIANPTFTGTVTLPTGTVTSGMILNDTIVNADINSTAAIAYSKLSLGGTITSADLVDGTIVNSDINASAGIALSKLATDPLARANHTGTQTASTISDFDTQVRTSKVTDLAAPTGSFSMNTQKITSLATPTTSTDASTKGYVDAQITALVGGAPGTLDTLKEIADAISSGGSFESTVVLKSGSTMTGALTLSGSPTVDLHAATKAYVDTVAGSATAAAASAAAAATTYDNFDDRYLGAKTSAPSVDNDGNSLITGAIYWNSTTNAMYAWTGTEWGSISSTAAIFRYRFNASGGETSLSGTDANGVTLSYLPGKEQVYLNGVLLARTSDYTASTGTSITSLAALAASDVVEIITFTSFELATAIDKTLFDAKGDILVATAADTPGKLAVGTNGYFLKANSSTATGLEWAAVDLSAKQDVVSGVSSTEIGYLDGVTSAIQTQIDSKLSTSTASSTYSTISSNNDQDIMQIMQAY